MDKPLDDDLGFLLSRASGAVVRATNTALAGHGLRVRQYSVLVLACDAADGVTQRELAGTLGLDPSQVVVLVDDLVAAGLVERRSSPADRRARLVTATAAGRAARSSAELAALAALEEPLRPLSPAERDQLRGLLARVRAGSSRG